MRLRSDKREQQRLDHGSGPRVPQPSGRWSVCAEIHAPVGATDLLRFDRLPSPAPHPVRIRGSRPSLERGNFSPVGATHSEEAGYSPPG